MFDDFESQRIRTGETGIFVRKAGSGPPLLLLHGFPETHLMWRDVAPLLAREYTVVCADLRGYGQSGAPPSTPDHASYSKRAMALDLVYVMQHLGFERFSVAGHDRGGRVAYRMALDCPENVERLAVLDIVPTDAAWQRADAMFALGFWPWTLLAQPEPLPERLLLTTSDAFIADAAATWGTSPEVFPPAVREAYVTALRDPAHAHAICEEYRAAATIDREHDVADRAAGNRIKAPLLALWSANGPLASWYEAEGGPLALWREVADDVQGRAVEGGHFFPEERPEETAAALAGFFDGDEG
jgi:haloacetate dehalogenase